MLTTPAECRLLFEASQAQSACDPADIATQASQFSTFNGDLVRLEVTAVVGKLDCNIPPPQHDFQIFPKV